MFITIKNLEKSYGSPDNKTFVLKGIDCTIEKGMICSLLGPSGSGKSTLLNITGGIDLAERGEIIIDGLHLEKMSQDGYIVPNIPWMINFVPFFAGLCIYFAVRWLQMKKIQKKDMSEALKEIAS